MFHPAVGEIEVVRHCGILRRKGVYLLHIRHNATAFPVPPHREHGLIDGTVFRLQHMPGNLKIAEPVDLGVKQVPVRQVLE